MGDGDAPWKRPRLNEESSTGVDEAGREGGVGIRGLVGYCGWGTGGGGGGGGGCWLNCWYKKCCMYCNCSGVGYGMVGGILEVSRRVAGGTPDAGVGAVVTNVAATCGGTEVCLLFSDFSLNSSTIPKNLMLIDDTKYLSTSRSWVARESVIAFFQNWDSGSWRCFIRSSRVSAALECICSSCGKKITLLLVICQYTIFNMPPPPFFRSATQHEGQGFNQL